MEHAGDGRHEHIKLGLDGNLDHEGVAGGFLRLKILFVNRAHNFTVGRLAWGRNCDRIGSIGHVNCEGVFVDANVKLWPNHLASLIFQLDSKHKLATVVHKEVSSDGEARGALLTRLSC